MDSDAEDEPLVDVIKKGRAKSNYKKRESDS